MTTIKTLLIGFVLSFSAMATSVTLNDPYGPNTVGDVIGDKTKFDIQSLTISDNTAKTVTVNALLNYGGTAAMNSFTVGTFTNLNIGDVLFSLGGAYTYAIILHAHDGLAAGNLYQITGVQTAFSLFGVSDPSGTIYRQNAAVWASATGATKVNSVAGTSVGTLIGSGPEISVNVSFSLSGVNTTAATNFLSNYATSNISFASATCGNDIVATPEPASMAMMGLGLAALGLFGRRKLMA